jgi:hypothetical protein
VRRRAKKAGDAGPEEIEEGAAWGESAAPPVEQDKKKKEPEGNACAWRVRRERRETLSLSYPQAFRFFIGMPGGNPRPKAFLRHSDILQTHATCRDFTPSFGILFGILSLSIFISC